MLAGRVHVGGPVVVVAPSATTRVDMVWQKANIIGGRFGKTRSLHILQPAAWVTLACVAFSTRVLLYPWEN